MTEADPPAPRPLRVLPYGRAAVLIEVSDAEAVADLHAALRERPAAGVLELVPAARTVLIRLDPTLTSPAAIGAHARQALAARQPLAALGARSAATSADPPSDGIVTIDVVYDGADLDELSSELGLSAQEIVTRHSGATYRCAFCGFAPGFSYLVGLDPALRARRLAEPRVRVPAGAVAIAGEFAAVYPAASPGGWRLLGRTDAPMWDAARPSPALAPPGALVRFAPARAVARGS